MFFEFVFENFLFGGVVWVGRIVLINKRGLILLGGFWFF